MAKEDKRESGKEVLRLFRLDALLQTDKYYTKDELAELLNVSIPTELFIKNVIASSNIGIITYIFKPIRIIFLKLIK